MERDQSDLGKILEKLQSCNPFSGDPDLRNVVSDAVAKDDVNVHNLLVIGKELAEKLPGQPVLTYACKRRDKAKTLGDSSAVQIAADR